MATCVAFGGATPSYGSCGPPASDLFPIYAPPSRSPLDFSEVLGTISECKADLDGYTQSERTGALKGLKLAYEQTFGEPFRGSTPTRGEYNRATCEDWRKTFADVGQTFQYDRDDPASQAAKSQLDQVLKDLFRPSTSTPTSRRFRGPSSRPGAASSASRRSLPSLFASSTPTHGYGRPHMVDSAYANHSRPDTPATTGRTLFTIPPTAPSVAPSHAFYSPSGADDTLYRSRAVATGSSPSTARSQYDFPTATSRTSRYGRPSFGNGSYVPTSRASLFSPPRRSTRYSAGAGMSKRYLARSSIDPHRPSTARTFASSRWTPQDRPASLFSMPPSSFTLSVDYRAIYRPASSVQPSYSSQLPSRFSSSTRPFGTSTVGRTSTGGPTQLRSILKNRRCSQVGSGPELGTYRSSTTQGAGGKKTVGFAGVDYSDF